MTRQTSSRPLWLLACLALAAFFLLVPREAEAHPLGNFTINHHSQLDFADREARVTYVLDFAEIPTLQQKGRLDTDGDGKLSSEESAAYLDAELDALSKRLRLEVGDEVLPLRVIDRSAAYRPGQGGLPTLRIEARYQAELPEDWEERGAGRYTNGNYANRLGWREIVVRGGPGVTVEDSSAAATSISDELRSYPQDMLFSPPDQREANFTLVPGNGTAADDTAGQAAESVGTGNNGGVTDRLTSLVAVDRLSAAVVAISLLAAFFWGAAHALTPGHGKAVVAAYLVGARGTARHAGLLGLTVTLTHTAGVFALGAVTLLLSRYVLPEVLYPWLNVVSGLLVVAIGLSLLYRRLGGGKDEHTHHGHAHHDHTHAHYGQEHSHAPHDHPRSHSDHDRDSHDHISKEHSHALIHSHSHGDHGRDSRLHSYALVHSHSHGDHGYLQSDHEHVRGRHSHEHSNGRPSHEHVHPHPHGEHRHSHGSHAHSHHAHSHHGHEHSHLPPGADGSSVTWRSLVALGVSGGLVPCPAALVLLLGAISLDRLGFGVVLVVAFSVGLAIVLTAIGLVMIYARRLFERFSFEARMPRLFPIVSALGVSIAGLAITLGALGQSGLV